MLAAPSYDWTTNHVLQSKLFSTHSFLNNLHKSKAIVFGDFLKQQVFYELNS